jgi:hypothetical protein
MKFRYLLIVFLLNFFLTNFIFIQKSLASCTLSGSDYSCTGTSDPLNNYSIIGSVTNSGNIVNESGDAIFNGDGGTIDTITNSGSISGASDYASGIRFDSSIQNIINTSTGTISGAQSIYVDGYTSITSITNSGNIVGTYQGIYNYYGSIGTATLGTGIINSGTISGSS